MNKTVFLMLFLACTCYAENIDPYEDGSQYGYGENVGWVNFEPRPGLDGVQVYSDSLSGSLWGENIGWINLSPTTYGGVTNDGSGNLSGFAWGENVGWINFDPNVPGDTDNQYKVTVDADGFFSGWAWGENIGWIRLDDAQAYGARACVVTFDDLANFVIYWLEDVGLPANMDMQGNVEFNDYAILASYWEDFCPEWWLLKSSELK